MPSVSAWHAGASVGSSSVRLWDHFGRPEDEAHAARLCPARARAAFGSGVLQLSFRLMHQFLNVL